MTGVSRDEVRRIALLARIAVPDDRLDQLALELNGILGHMNVLASAPPASDEDHGPGMRLAPDHGRAVPLVHSPEAFAPEWRDGFFLVPRLGTHEDAGGA